MENPTSKLGKGKWTSKSVGCLRHKEEKGVGRARDIYSSKTSEGSLRSFEAKALFTWWDGFFHHSWHR
eukprot:1854591-Amphidinium_carterae.1